MYEWVEFYNGSAEDSNLPDEHLENLATDLKIVCTNGISRLVESA